MQVYLARNNVQAGPYSIEQLNSMLANGDVLQNDLIWHQGMEDWKTIAEVTNGQVTYYPDGFVPTVTTHLEQQERTRTRTTVDELYGNRPADSADKPVQEPHPVAHVPTKSTMRKNRAKKSAPTYELASPTTRILATFLDGIIGFLTIIPIILHIQPEKVRAILNSGMSSLEILQTIQSQTPNHIMIMSIVFSLLMFFVQIMMLIKKGQTLGKFATGLKILDKTSQKLPTITNIVLLRTLLTNFIYNLPLIGSIFLIADLASMLINKDKQSLHDKLAKTIVVKASDEQIEPANHKK